MEMTCNTSEVAVCCSSASDNSRVRACTSSNSRTFSIAITAWSQYKELRAIRGALGRLRGISYALYIILGINLVILAGLAGLAWLALRDVPFW